MNLPLPAHQLTLNELIHYGSDSPLVARLVECIEELEEELEEEKSAYETEVALMEKMYNELETRFLELKEKTRDD